MDTREELEKELKRVKDRLEILDMIEERLFKMRKLAEKAVDNELDKSEIERINQEVKYLQEQIRLLDAESTDLS